MSAVYWPPLLEGWGINCWSGGVYAPRRTHVCATCNGTGRVRDCELSLECKDCDGTGQEQP